jgi:hypothetical protein
VIEPRVIELVQVTISRTEARHMCAGPRSHRSLRVLAVLSGQLTLTVISPFLSLDFSTRIVVPVPATTTLPPGLFTAS